jgi:DNA polymerase elongation subunit (family B)
MSQLKGPKILTFDIETAPILAYVWSIWEQNVGLNQIKSDWHVLSWAAKWHHKKEVLYRDQRNSKDVTDDKAILKELWELLNEADIVVSQNGKAFDSKKVNARFLVHGFGPPSPYKHIDTKELAKRNFAFTSNKLEYMSEKVNTKYRKHAHHKFSGFELWSECLKGNKKAWAELEKYNKIDVLATEELYEKLAPWGTPGVDFNVYRPTVAFLCQCGSDKLTKNGFHVTIGGKFQRYKCQDCGRWCQEKGQHNNILPTKKRKSLTGPV